MVLTNDDLLKIEKELDITGKRITLESINRNKFGYGDYILTMESTSLLQLEHTLDLVYNHLASLAFTRGRRLIIMSRKYPEKNSDASIKVSSIVIEEREPYYN